MKALAASILWLSLLALPGSGAAADAVVLEDPRGDDRGPGSYTYPTGSEYRRGDFDLRSFSVRVEGKQAVIELTLGANVRREIVSQRGNASDLDLANGLYVQHVDIYVDTTPNAGFTEALPGRRVAFAPESAWDRAIVLTPRPGPMRTVLNGWNVEAAQKVLTPGPVRSKGATMTVRIPLAQLGGEPQKTWGWSVMVSGAAWEQGFAVFDRITGKHAPDAFTVPVVGVPEDDAFGGARLNDGHPQIIDVILPAGVTQQRVLGTFSPSSPAVVPMVYPDPARASEVAAAKSEPTPKGSAPAPMPSTAAPASDRPVVAPVPGAPGPDSPRNPTVADTPPSSASEPDRVVLQIASIDGDTAVIPSPNGGVGLWQMGAVLDDHGTQIGRVVVTNAGNGFVIANITDGKGRVVSGQQVRFAVTSAGRR
jgi:hypothetical protein